MLRRIATITAIAAAAGSPAVATAALEGAPATTMNQATIASAGLSATGSGGALTFGSRLGQINWSVSGGDGNWTLSPHMFGLRTPEVAAPLGDGTLLVSTGVQGLNADHLNADGTPGAHTVLDRDGYGAHRPAIAVRARQSVLVAFVETQDGRVDGRHDLRVASLAPVADSFLVFFQTLAGAARILGAPVIAASGDRAVVAWVALNDAGDPHLHAAIRQDGSWEAPVDLGATSGLVPDVAASADGRLAVVAQGTDGRVRVRIAPAGAGLGAPVVVSGSADIGALDVELDQGQGAAVMWTRSLPDGGQRAEARTMWRPGAWGPVSDLGASAVDGPGEQGMTAVAGNGYVATWNTVHGPDDYGTVVAQMHGGTWRTTPVDGVGDTYVELSPSVTVLSGGDAMVSWVRLPAAGEDPRGEIRAQRVSANAPVVPPAPQAAPDPAPGVAPPAGAPAAPAAAAPAAPAATPAAARPRTARLKVRWTRSGRALRATITRRADSTGYRMVARKGATTRSARCIAKRVKGVRRQVCTVKLGKGRWTVTASSRKGRELTATARRAVRVR
jgi:hypothetical protein